MIAGSPSATSSGHFYLFPGFILFHLIHDKRSGVTTVEAMSTSTYPLTGFVTCLIAGCLVIAATGPGSALGEEKVEGQLFLKDALSTPNQPVSIEALLVRKALVGQRGLGGEPVELMIDKKTVATAMTGGDGRAFFEYRPTTRGIYGMTVKLGHTMRVTAVEAAGVLAVWEKRQPLLMVEVSALMEEPQSEPLPGLPLSLKRPAIPKAVPDAPNELRKLSRFYYNVIYVLWSPNEEALFDLAELRRWLQEQKFPLGYLVKVQPGRAALGGYLEQLKQQGWSTVKVGIGRNRAFAEALIEQRLDVVIVPEPSRGELPRKAKTAKDWKQVRKKL